MEQAYQFAINNCASYLASLTEAQRASGECHNAFSLSAAIGIAFCKSKEEVILDIIRAKK
jgi:hypothetical protein